MASNNPSLTVNDIITDVEGRLNSPNISNALYFPWISTSAQRVYRALCALGQEAKERYFGASDTINLSTSTLEHDILASIPDFGGFIGVEVLYGASGDTRVRATKMRSVSQWEDLSNVSTNYRAKQNPLYYQSGNNIGIIPVPPESGAIAYVRYIRRLPQYDSADDVINIPYRFTWPIYDYVEAKALQRANEDFSTSREIEDRFRVDIQEITETAADELNENDGTNAVEVSANSAILDDPMGAI